MVSHTPEASTSRDPLSFSTPGFSHNARVGNTSVPLPVDGLFGAAQALAERYQHARGQRRNLAKERDEVAPGNHQQSHGGVGDDRGRARLAVGQADLAEERARDHASLV